MRFQIIMQVMLTTTHTRMPRAREYNINASHNQQCNNLPGERAYIIITSLPYIRDERSCILKMHEFTTHFRIQPAHHK